MRFKKLKIFVAIAIILFILASVEIVTIGLLSKKNNTQIQDVLLLNTSQTTQDKKNLTVVNINNTPIVNVPVPIPVTPPRSRAS